MCRIHFIQTLDVTLKFLTLLCVKLKLCQIQIDLHNNYVKSKLLCIMIVSIYIVTCNFLTILRIRIMSLRWEIQVYERSRNMSPILYQHSMWRSN